MHNGRKSRRQRAPKILTVFCRKAPRSLSWSDLNLARKYWERVYEAGAPVKQKSASFALGPQASQRSGR